MSDILSQSEIDALLMSMAGGDGGIEVEADSKKEAKNYDFARPSKFNKEHLRSLELIFDNYSRNLSSFLSAYLRTSTTIEVVGAEQVTYNEFNSILVNPVILSIINLAPLKGSIVLDISANIGYSIIDRILGGPGFGIEKLREFSEIEKILIERVVTQMLGFFPEAWANVAPLKPKLEKIETNSQFAQIIAANEMTALITLAIKVGGMEGFLNFCLPYIVMEPIMDKLNTKYWFTNMREDDEVEHGKDIESKLETAKVDISAVIGRTRIMVSDFVNMQPGDIIPLDSYVNSDLQVMVGSLLKFSAKPGIHRGKNAIQITSIIEKEE